MVHVGTSGFSYPEWRGTFYPKRCPTARMLPWYAARFHTVELNNTFYRMPTASAIAGWDRDTPAGFVFALKVPQHITHFARLRAVAKPLRDLLRTAGGLGAKLGPLLLQLPPNFRKDAGRLRACLARVPPSVRMAVEFRHPSWFDDEVYGILRDRNAALCVADTEAGTTPVVVTADFGYLRLRDRSLQAGGADPVGEDRHARGVARRVRVLQARGVGDRPRPRAKADRQPRRPRVRRSARTTSIVRYRPGTREDRKDRRIGGDGWTAVRPGGARLGP